MNKKALILITNDDGIRSPGLRAAAEAVSDIAEIIIAAPHLQQTGMGRAFVRSEDTGIIELHEIEIKNRKVRAYGIHGTPAFAVAHGVLELSDRKPDLCISGINYGENMGTVLTCSGTLGAVFEAFTYGIPGIAISLETALGKQRSEDFQDADFSLAAAILQKWAQKVLQQGMPLGADILNINVPSDPRQKGTWKMTVQSKQNYFEFEKPVKRDLSSPFALQSTRVVDVNTLEKNSDIYTVYIERKISVTPLKVNMSAL